MKNIKPIYLVITITIAILCFAVYKYFFGETARVQKNMQAYLKDYYGQEFVVKRPVRTGNEGFGYKKWIGSAYPVDEPTFEFVVDWDIGEPGYYYDDYANKKRSREGDVLVGKYIKEVYGKDVFVQTWLATSKDLNLLSFNELLEQYGPRCNFRCSIYIFLNTSIDKGKEAEKAFKFYQKYIQANRLGNYTMNIFYLPINYQNEFREKADVGVINTTGNTIARIKILPDQVIKDSQSIEKECFSS